MIFPLTSTNDYLSGNLLKLRHFKMALPGILCSLLLLSCGSPPKKPVSQPISQAPQQDVVVEPESAQDWLNTAESTTGRPQIQALLAAAEAYQAQHCAKSIAIVKLLPPEQLDDELNSHARLIWAECAWENQNYDSAFSLVNQVSPMPGLAQRKFRLEAELYSAKALWWQAAEKLANIPESDRQLTELIWSYLENIPTPELQQRIDQASLLQPLLQLQMIQRSFALEPDNLHMAVQEWQSRYNWHTFASHPPEKLSQLLSSPIYAPAKLGIILPLTGKLTSQGSAIKDGILAAYFTQQEKNSINNATNTQSELVFIDSNTSELLLTEQFAELDFVLGPLLKENIVKFAPYIQSPWLALNFVENEQDKNSVSQQYYFALSPEDEGIQMARHLYKLGLSKPLIIQADNSSAQRMAQAFIEQWNTYSLEPAEEVVFTDNLSMRNGISDLLAISNSKQRIKQIESLVINEVHAFERNRRDADAIVIFANASQTELITPYIEANTSPFADILPVFASSRSHSTRKNQNSLRDLRNLIFLDMPWMLPEHHFPQLKDTSQTLWPKRQDNNQRLFAMGYDAYQLIGHLRALQILPGYQYKGLTGNIYMDENKQLRRQLFWGQVRDEKVVRYQMD